MRLAVCGAILGLKNAAVVRLAAPKKLRLLMLASRDGDKAIAIARLVRLRARMELEPFVPSVAHEGGVRLESAVRARGGARELARQNGIDDETIAHHWPRRWRLSWRDV